MKRLLIALLISTSFLACSENSTKEKEVSRIQSSTEKKNSTAIETVKTFIEDLGAGQFEAAFEKQKVKAWGNFEHFSSKKAFGGITSVTIKTIEEKADEDGKAVIYADVFYAAEGGNNTFRQNYYLQQFSGEWMIVKMKVIETVIQKISEEDVKKELKKFLLPNKKVRDFAIGDINNDNIGDVILVQSDNNNKDYYNEDSHDIVYILIRDGKYNLSIHSTSTIECYRKSQDLSFNKNGTFSIGISDMNGANGIVNTSYTFDYSKNENKFYLSEIFCSAETFGRNATSENATKTKKDFGLMSFETTKIGIEYP